MLPRTILAVALLTGVTVAPRCATRSPYAAPRQAAMPEAAPATGESSASTAPEAKPAAAAGVDTPPKAAPATAGSSASTIPEAQTAAAAGAEASSDPFRETIQPILSARCGACHDPGGKMYARLPFDNPQVVSSHSEGVLKRLKGDDRAALERWLAGLAPAGGQR
ncbi:MAG TPA: hypothetical protein VGB47_01955 [Thermoanaerobaculia bacterium]|jgi:hypothetical protein